MTDGPGETRQRILESAATLLERVGAEAISLREVCRAAGVTAPTVYHHFGDKRGLFEAVAEEGFARYLSGKLDGTAAADPLDVLRRSWDNHIGFGLGYPSFYRLMYGTPNAEERPAARRGHRILVGLLERLAESGRLRLPAEPAAMMVHTAAVGTTLMLLSAPAGPGTTGLADRMRDAVFGAVLHQDQPSGERAVTGSARTLLVTLSARGTPELTPGERAIVLELLAKLAH